jgi:hypothetical protein
MVKNGGFFSVASDHGQDKIKVSESKFNISWLEFATRSRFRLEPRDGEKA